MDATKANVKKVLTALASPDDNPRGLATGLEPDLRKATPDDLLIIFYAGHGYTAPDGTFYLFPSDIGRDNRYVDDVLKDGRAISSHELSHWLQGVDVGRAVMIVDACQSAGAVAPPGFKVGPFGSQGLGQMAYDKGMQVLAASQSDEAAIESATWGRGTDC